MPSFSNVDIMDLARSLGSNPEKATPSSVCDFFIKSYFSPSGGGFNYLAAIEALRFGFEGKFTLDDAIHHVNSRGAPLGQKYNEAVIRAIWPEIELHVGRAYPLKYTAIPLRRINDVTIYTNIKSPIITVSEDRSVIARMTNFRNTFAPNYNQKRFMLSFASEILTQDDFEDASVQLIEARSPKGTSQRQMNVLNSNDVELYDIDRVEDMLTIYTQGIQMLFDLGHETKSADLSRYRVVNRDAPDLFR